MCIRDRIRIQPSLQGLTASVAGRRFAVEVRDPRDASRSSRAATGSGRQNVTAPMPGKVVRVLVETGDLVAVSYTHLDVYKRQNERRVLSRDSG